MLNPNELCKGVKTVIFDCDDVLANLKVDLAHSLSELGNRFVHYNEWTEWDACYSNYQFDGYDAQPLMIKNKILENTKPIAHAQEYVNLYKEDGFQIVVMTARGWHPNAKAITERWLEQHNFDVDAVIVTDHNKTKGQMIGDMIRMGVDVKAYYDDNPNNISSMLDWLQRNNHESFYIRMVEQPWNRNDAAMSLCYGWGENEFDEPKAFTTIGSPPEVYYENVIYSTKRMAEY